MKPYNERLPLIDAAIDYFTTSYGGYPSECQYMIEFCTEKGDWTAVYHSDNHLFTRDEFNQRKAELQNKPKFSDHPDAKCFVQNSDGWWLKNVVTSNLEPDDIGGWSLVNYNPLEDGAGWWGSGWKLIQKGTVIGRRQDTLEKRPETEQKEQPIKYEYGIEYETNGEKPDLPDDVEVEFKSRIHGDWSAYGKDKACSWAWRNSKSFRIVDERYKPKEQDMSDWYEKGELPPVGEIVEYFSRFDEDWNGPAKVFHITKKGVCFVEYEHGGYDKSSSTEHFRPIPTETDNLVEQAISDAEKHTSLISTSTVESLIKAGYRKIKPMSEDEFVVSTTNFGVSGEGARFLFKRGCRFIDNGITHD